MPALTDCWFVLPAIAVLAALRWFWILERPLREGQPPWFGLATLTWFRAPARVGEIVSGWNETQREAASRSLKWDWYYIPAYGAAFGWSVATAAQHLSWAVPVSVPVVGAAADVLENYALLRVLRVGWQGRPSALWTRVAFVAGGAKIAAFWGSALYVAASAASCVWQSL